VFTVTGLESEAWAIMERTSEEIRQEMNQVRHSISMLENTWIALQKDYLDAHRKEMEAEVRKDFEEERGKN
jgi:hypothetical protein